MDKLQPLLVHRFWICGGVAVIMSTLGWWLSTSGLAAETEKRIGEVKAAKSKAIVEPDAPNRIWVEQLNGVNTNQDILVDESREAMWVQQEQLMKWPSGVVRYMAGKNYREKSESAVQTVFQQFYDAERERIRHIVRPFTIEEDGGVVYFPVEVMPAPDKYLNKQAWYAPLGWEELWDAAEDLWLVEDLIASINEVNSGYESVANSPIRGIYRFEFHGGQPRKLAEEEDGDSDGTDSGSSDGMDAYGSGDGMEMAPGTMPMGEAGGGAGFGGPGIGFGSGMQGNAGGGQEFAAKPAVIINPVEVFGAPTQLQTASGEESGDDGSGSASGGMGMGMGMGVGAEAGGQGAQLRRYVDDGDELPFKTRGFVLGLIVHHNHVPKVIAELTASNWPVEILRVHQQDVFEDPLGRGLDGGADGSPEGPAGTGYPGTGTGSSFPSSSGSSFGPEGGGQSGSGEPEVSPIWGFFKGQQGGGAGESSMGSQFGARSPAIGGSFGAGAAGSPLAATPGRTFSSAPGRGPEAGQEQQQPPGYQSLNSAFLDRGLVRLEIAGLLTLYSPPQVKPEEGEGTDGGDASPTDAATPEPSTPATPGETVTPDIPAIPTDGTTPNTPTTPEVAPTQPGSTVPAAPTPAIPEQPSGAPSEAAGTTTPDTKPADTSAPPQPVTNE